MVHTYSLHDVTIIIPVRIDHADRLTNLNVILEYFSRFFINADIRIIEADRQPRVQTLATSAGCHYTFQKKDGPFHKTRLVNLIANESDREIIALHDADVLFRPEAIQSLVTAFRQTPNCHYGLPYNGVFLNLREPAKNLLLETWDFSIIPLVMSGELHREYAPGVVCVNPVSVGGANYFRRETFLQLGGCNESFISCIWEDYEIEARFTKMGFPAAIIRDANALHLHHTRVSDAETQKYNQINRQKYERICGMTREELERYIREDLLRDTTFSRNRE